MQDQSEDQTKESQELHTTVDDGTTTAQLKAISCQETVSVDDSQTPIMPTGLTLQSQIEGLTNSLAEIAASLIMMRNSYTQVIANQAFIRKLVIAVLVTNLIGWFIMFMVFSPQNGH